MNRTITTLVIGALAASSMAQISLYSPARSLKEQSMSTRAWGSGTISETDELAYEGTYSVRVSTRNFFQGGTLLMEKATILNTAFNDKNNLLQFMIRVADVNLTLGGAGTPGRPSGAGAGKGGGLAGGEGGESGGAQGGPAGSGAGRQGPTATMNPDATKLKNLRFVFTTSDGLKSEVYLPINAANSGKTGWLPVSIPLQAITGLARTNKEVTALAISGDAISTFYIGDIRVVNDSTPISAEMSPNQSLNLALGDEVEFRGRGFGGSSVLKYTWDFDNQDGIQEDAQGDVIKRRFRIPGTYVVTLTVTDAYGLKKPYSTSISIKVNP